MTREVKLSSADRVLFPKDGITKGDLFEYYDAVADVLVPHLRDRPFTMKRWREGVPGGSFFQKQVPKGTPSWIPTRQFTTRQRDGDDARGRLRARQPAGGAPLDGADALHRHERLVLARRQAAPARLGALRHRPARRRRVAGRRRGRAPHPRAPAGARARVVGEDERLDGHPRDRPDRAALHLGRHVRVRRAGRARARGRASRDAHDAVAEGEADRRPRRSPPERLGQDDRVRLLGAAARRRAGVDAAAVGGADAGPRLPALGMAEALARVERDGDLFAPVLDGGQSLGPALRRLRDEAPASAARRRGCCRRGP